MKIFLTIILILSVYAQASDKIKLDVNFESLCPGCGQFITTNLAPALDKGLLDMVEVTLVPFGNASETKQGDKWAFTCQHGQEECDGNAVENCVLKHVTDAMTKLKANVCIEQIANIQGKGFPAAIDTCSKQYKFDAAAVTACSQGDEGNALTHAAAQATPSDHQYVPWVVVDGVHPGQTDENSILDDVFAWACNNYKGSNKPTACPTQVSRKIQFCMKNTVSNQIKSLFSKITAEE